MAKAVSEQITTVSAKTSKMPHRPCSGADRTSAEAWAMAAELIGQFGNIDNLLANTALLKGKMREKVEAAADDTSNEVMASGSRLRSNEGSDDWARNSRAVRATPVAEQ